MEKEKKGKGKKIAIGVAAVVAVAAVAVPTGLMFAGGSKEASANTENNKYTIVVSSSLEGQADYTLSVEKGTKISTLRTMLKAIDGYDIAGIYKDASLTTEYKDDEYISEDAKIFIKFEALTYTVKVYDESKQLVETISEIDHGTSLSLEDLADYEDNFAKYKFVGWEDERGNLVDITNITRNLELYPSFKQTMKEYSFGYSFGDGNDYSSSIKVSVGGEEKTLNDTYHYGSTIKIKAQPAAGHEVSEFKVTVAGQTTDLLTYAYMVVDNGEVYYETEFTGNGNITITYNEVVKQAYSIGTIPEGIKVTRNGTTLANNAEIYFGDELEITKDSDFEDIDNSFEIVNAKHALGDIYYVTGNMTITFEGVYKYAYLNFTQLEDKTYKVTGLNDETVTDIVIPSTYKGEKVASIGSSAFNYKKLTSVVISDGVETIGGSAFYECRSLTSVNIPESIIKIEDQAFWNCTGLERIDFNAINCANFANENMVFANIGSRSSGITVNIGKSVQQLPNNLFFAYKNINGGLYYTPNIIEVNIEANLTKISRSAFSYCKKLKSITIPSSVKGIEYSAFNYCTSLSSIVIPNSVISIGERAFYECESLTSITIPENVTFIGQRAFSYCYGLTEINYNATNCDNLEKETFSGAGKNSGGVTINFGEKVEAIPGDLFYENSGSMNIVAINMGDSVKHISSSFYNNCKNLVSFTIGNNVSVIDRYAINNFDNIEFNEYKNGLYLGNSENPYMVLFKVKDTEAETFEINPNTKLIYSSFNSPTNAQLVEYDNGLYFGTSDNPYYALIKIKNNSLTECKIHENTKLIAPSAFEKSNIKSIEIPDGVTNIGNSAFNYCRSLTSVIIPDSVTGIGRSAFSDCSSLTEISLGSGLTAIGNYAFIRSAISSIRIPPNVSHLDESVFSQCSNLKEVIIENEDVYKKAVSASSAGYLLNYAKTIKVLASIVDNPSNTNILLNDETKYTKTLSDDGLYYIYSKI